MNKIILTGRLTKDVEVRYTTNMAQYSPFTLAVERIYKSQDGSKQADFVTCIAWQKVSELMAKYCSKGSKILVEGRFETNTYEKEGKTHYAYNVVVEKLEFLESRNKSKSDLTPTDFVENISDDQLPF